MFEDKTYEKLLEEALATAPPGVDVRQGSIFYDAVASNCFQIAKYYADLRTAFDLVSLTTAVDEYLDQKGAEYGVYRNNATSACYQFSYTGSQPALGERFFAEGKYFKLRQGDSVPRFLESETVGTDDNNIIAGTLAMPVNNLRGLTSSAFGNLLEPGIDTENDEDFRQRIREKVAGPAENGNRQHYKTWCEEVSGVGRARIIPLFAGENTVMGVISSAEGTPATEAVVERVQEYIDPIAKGLSVQYEGQAILMGDGLGNGVANIGAHFAAVSAIALPITVSFSAELASGFTLDDAKAEASKVMTAYLKDLALDTPDNENVIVRLSTVGALLYALESIIDYTDLAFNGASANVEVSGRQVAVLEGVIINAIV